MTVPRVHPTEVRSCPRVTPMNTQVGICGPERRAASSPRRRTVTIASSRLWEKCPQHCVHRRGASEEAREGEDWVEPDRGRFNCPGTTRAARIRWGDPVGPPCGRHAVLVGRGPHVWSRQRKRQRLGTSTAPARGRLRSVRTLSGARPPVSTSRRDVGHHSVIS